MLYRHLTIVSLFQYDQPAHLVPNQWPDAHIQLLWEFNVINPPPLPICKILWFAFTKCSSTPFVALLSPTQINCVLPLFN